MEKKKEKKTKAKTIDKIEDIRTRNTTIQMSENLSVDDKLSILRNRAKELAVELNEDNLNEDFIEVIEFSLGKENYAFETEYVKEVYLLNNFTSLPGLPNFIIGITNIRGQILSIIDLRKLFNLTQAGLGELNKIIILKNENMEFGILADVILGTRLVSLNSLNKSYTKMPGIGAEYLKAVSNEHLIILNAESILEDKEIIINQL